MTTTNCPVWGASASVSNEEFRLGRAWLRQFRAGPSVAGSYCQQPWRPGGAWLPDQLGSLQTTTVMVDNRSLNAFAVPGGVVGINSGLFAFAEDEGAFCR